MLVLRTTPLRLGPPAALRASVTFRKAPGLPPDSDCVAVAVPPPGVVNWVSAQSASRKVLSETVWADAGVDNAMTVAIVNEASCANLARVQRTGRITGFSPGLLGKFFTRHFFGTRRLGSTTRSISTAFDCNPLPMRSQRAVIGNASRALFFPGSARAVSTLARGHAPTAAGTRALTTGTIHTA